MSTKKNKWDDIHFNSALLAKEMERRGIEVHHEKGTKKLVATYKTHTEEIDDTDLLSVMPQDLRSFLDHKWETKKVLKKEGFPVAPGKTFKISQLNEALAFAQKHFPVVIKPTSGCHGYGIRMNIDSPREFDIEFRKLVKFLDYETDILVEQQIPGQEFRLTVTKNGFFAGIYRSCPSIIGDGKHTIQELIDKENHRRMNPRDTCLCEIWTEDGEVQRYLSKKGMKLSNIPALNEIIMLRTNSNVCTGAEAIDVTDLIHPFYHKLALEVMVAFPGLPYAGIDLITPDITQYEEGKTKYTICEVNPAPGLSLHTHPSEGTPRDLPSALIDMIFPETIQSLFGTKPRVKIIHPTLTTFDQLKNHFQKKAPKDWWYKPISLELEINTVCNLRCTGCVIIDDIENPTHEFSTKQLLDILKQSAELGVYNYSLTGGEPFLVTDQICDIIAQAPIDIFKIQTNATRFNTEKSALKILNQLKKAGFVSRNKYVKPSINVSLGMQTLEGAPIECVAILTKTFLETFGKTAQLGLNLVPYVKGIDDENTLDKLEAAYESLYGEKFPYQKIRLNQFELQYTPRLEEEKIISTKKTTIKKLIKSRNNNTACFNFTKKIDTPVPRFMIRADGKFYPCACFGHAFLAGNINNDSLYNLLTRVNTNEQLRVVFDKGLYGLLKLTEKTNPQLANMEIPETLHPCRACRLLRFPEDLPDIIKIGG